MIFHPLSPEEKKVIDEKGTERPGTGEYEHTKKPGVYLCRKCDNPLFISSDKFDSNCGWPSFDDEIKEAVLSVADKDGIRLEILCSRCQGHLGHVFKGEWLTRKNTRYCVNSISMVFNEADTKEGLKKALLAAGCFWGVEHLLKQVKGVKSVVSGYTGGFVVDPDYKSVCHGDTGHKEAVLVLFDPEEISYESILKKFFELHDFTQVNGQGPDLGSQYQSMIYYFTEEGKKTAQSLIDQLEFKGFKVATRLKPASRFYPAEAYHQDYYEIKGGEPYCHVWKKQNWD